VAARRGIASGAPALLPARDVADPARALPALHAALRAAAPPACAGTPVTAVLGCGDALPSAAEETVLAEALGAPLVTASDLWPRLDGGVTAGVSGRRVPIDVLHLRVDDAELAASRTSTGQTVGTLLAEAVRAGRLGLANVPGNGLADDLTTHAGVPAMIRFYLGEEPRLDQVPTWVLADEHQWASVRERLHELVLVPVAAYGGGRPVVGPECSAAELAELQAEVAAAPHRFIARAPVDATTAPALVGNRLLPRPVDLRVFSVATGGNGVQVLDAPLTRVDLSGGTSGFDLGRGAAVKDTWLLLA
jgi:carboxylate-amine ligase